ncbi:MAG: CHRD domain-containing protein [Acidimicrobiales bacterium]
MTMKRNLTLAAGISAVFAAGSLFGPLNSASAGHTNSVLETSLRGRNEVPASPSSTKRIVGDPNGRGQAYVFGIDGDPTTLCYVLTVQGIEPATAAHIHKGAEGTNGPVVAGLGAPADGNSADCLTEGEAGKFPTGERVQDILANPADYYVNVHNASYPGGAIRGQLSAQR